MPNTKTKNFASFTADVTNQIIDELKKGKVIWKQPWTILGGCKNYVTKRHYTGFNQFYLAWQLQQKGYKHPLFMTYKQAVDAGGHVRKGEKGITVVFWKKILQSKKKEDCNDEKTQLRLYPFLHTVFNIEQIEGIDFVHEQEQTRTHSVIEACQLIINNMPAKPDIRHSGNQAFYSPSLDFVQLPLPEQFTSPENYYQTAFHELIHSTGHKSRLNRFKEGEKPARFGDESYSKEELIAEIGATILSAQSGIKDQVITSSAAYIKGWLRELKNDHSLIFSAANNAEKAVNWICAAAEEFAETKTTAESIAE